MKVLLLGSTGMLGQALYSKLDTRYSVKTLARANSDYKVDLMIEARKIKEIIETEKPDIIINAAALVNIQECEQNPGKAYLINGRVPGIISEVCKGIGGYFIQISTDHYYTNDGRNAHKENDEINLVNEYARTKYAGETFALTYVNSLVIRTNIVGFRNRKNKFTFAEWIFNSLENNQSILGFEDYYISSIDVYHFSDILMELIDKKVTGLINIASSDVLSKYEFIYKIADLLNKKELVKIAKLENLGGVPRGNSLGLDIDLLKSIILKEKIPSSQMVIEKLVEKYKEGAFYGI
jgi:dTDP-4-dehydrorhamnose reductase